MKKYQKLISLFFIFFSLNLYAQEDNSTKSNFTFNYPFSKVWDAAQIILGHYPLDTNDVDNAIIKTVALKPSQMWQPPFENKLPDEYSQIITFQFNKINSRQTRLQIIKTAKIKTDFLGSERAITPSNWEEVRIVYNIKREIEINNFLKTLK